MPESSGYLEVDLDFPAVPPGADTADISAPVPESPPETVAADRAARSRERRRPFAAVFFGIALLSLAAVGIMFAFQTGLLKSPQERDTSVPNPPAELGSEDFDPAEEELVGRAARGETRPAGRFEQGRALARLHLAVGPGHPQKRHQRQRGEAPGIATAVSPWRNCH